jgi:head-tail adaptor
MNCICPNDLTHTLTVERVKATATIDGSGNPDETLDSNWVQFGKEAAKCVTRGSREFVSGPQLKETVSHQWTIRWSQKASGYTTGMRLRLDGRKFYISAPPLNIDEADKWIRIDTEEVASV